MGQRAVYKDQRGQTYSAPIVFQDGQWLMRTSEGLAPITLQFDDDQGGRLEFVGYRDELDERLHIEPKQPGQSSLAQLQSAAAKVEAQARADRYHNAQQQVVRSNERDAAKVRRARQINNALAERWHTHREAIPPTQLTKETIGALAEEARYRKRKIEPEQSS